MTSMRAGRRPKPEELTPTLRFDHLVAMSDSVGLFEHALGCEPRREHGYCVDDVSRGLIVLMREPELSPQLTELARVYLAFLIESQTPDGLIRNRRSVDGRWTTEPSVGDWWGRAVWAFGTVAARAQDPLLSQLGLRHAERSMRLRAPYTRSMTFAALGAAEVATAWPGHREAVSLLGDMASMVEGPASGDWRWPEPRLTYANAAVAEALIAAGELTGSAGVRDNGLELLDWLLEHEVRDGHLSVVAAGGAGPTRPRPAFDQQGIEVAAIADACARAAAATGDHLWGRGIDLAAGWFEGVNDSGVPMYDPASGAGYDGLRRDGRNENCGAESTVSALLTLQQSSRLAGGGQE